MTARNAARLQKWLSRYDGRLIGAVPSLILLLMIYCSRGRFTESRCRNAWIGHVYDTNGVTFSLLPEKRRPIEQFNSSMRETCAACKHLIRFKSNQATRDLLLMWHIDYENGARFTLCQ